MIDRESDTNARKPARREKKRRKKPSHVCAQPAQPCSPADPRASMPGPVCFTGWLLAFLGRACGNTCETAIIMAFLSGGGGVRWQVCFPFHMSVRNSVPWDP